MEEKEPLLDPLLAALHERHLEMKTELENELKRTKLANAKLKRILERRDAELSGCRREIARLKPAADLLAVVERRVRESGS